MKILAAVICWDYKNYSLKVNHLESYTIAKSNKWEQAHAGDSKLIVNKYGKPWTKLCL